MKKKQRDIDESKCIELFVKYFDDRFGKMFIPKDKTSQIDLVTDDGENTFVWELKHTTTYTINSFWDVGAMIDVSKWNYLRALCNKNKVMYCRFYKDGYAVWYINELTSKDYRLSNEYVRKRKTRSTSTKTKSASILLDFNSAISIKRKETPTWEEVKRGL